jgi:hypothetical protein
LAMATHAPQPVITVADYVDGILTGVAHFNGEPRLFVPAEGSFDQPRGRYKLYAMAEIAPNLVLGPQDLWNPQQSVRDLIASLLEMKQGGHLAFGDFRPIGPSSSRGPAAMEVSWSAA